MEILFTLISVTGYCYFNYGANAENSMWLSTTGYYYRADADDCMGLLNSNYGY